MPIVPASTDPTFVAKLSSLGSAATASAATYYVIRLLRPREEKSREYAMPWENPNEDERSAVQMLIDTIEEQQEERPIEDLDEEISTHYIRLLSDAMVEVARSPASETPRFVDNVKRKLAKLRSATVQELGFNPSRSKEHHEQ